jgi:hypothetical protein
MQNKNQHSWKYRKNFTAQTLKVLFRKDRYAGNLQGLTVIEIIFKPIQNIVLMKHSAKNSDQNGKNQIILSFNPIKMLKIRIKMPFEPIDPANSG